MFGEDSWGFPSGVKEYTPLGKFNIFDIWLGTGGTSLFILLEFGDEVQFWAPQMGSFEPADKHDKLYGSSTLLVSGDGEAVFRL